MRNTKRSTERIFQLYIKDRQSTKLNILEQRLLTEETRNVNQMKAHALQTSTQQKQKQSCSNCNTDTHPTNECRTKKYCGICKNPGHE